MDTEAIKELLSAERRYCREVCDTRMGAYETALKLQAKEYERRLDGLNGEAGRLREMQASYVPRELWQTQHQELVSKIDGLMTFRDNLTGRMWGMGLAGGIIGGVIVGVIVWALTGR